MNTDHPFFSIRLQSAPAGHAFGEMLKKTTMNRIREDMIINEVLDGNVPTFLKSLCEVKVAPTASIFCIPDYLSIGSDEDFLRVPLNPMTAQKICDEIGFALPTKKVVNAIWTAANIKVEPRPKGEPYDSSMFSAEAIINSNIRIEIERKDRFGLMAGQKKDVICSNEIALHPGNVVIYGWTRLNGTVIQGVNGFSHDHNYADYSHGIRLLADTMIVDGKQVNYYDVVSDVVKYKLVSDEGCILQPKYKY